MYPPLLRSVFVLGLISIALMVVDLSTNWLQPLRLATNYLGTPFYWAAAVPERIEQWGSELLSSKTDLINDDGLDGLEARLRDMNRMAKIIRSENANVPVDSVLNLSAFKLDDILERRPSFLEPEYPFEWTGVYSLEPGRYELSLAEGPDPEMSLVIQDEQGKEDDDLMQTVDDFVDRYLDKEGWDSEDEDTLYLDGERLISDILHMLQKKYPDITFLEE